MKRHRLAQLGLLLLGSACGGGTSAAPIDGSVADAPTVQADAASDVPTGDIDTRDSTVPSTDAQPELDATSQDSESGLDGSAYDAALQDGVLETSASQVYLTVDAGLEVDPSCSGLPPHGFGFETAAESCFEVTVDAGTSDVSVCLPPDLTTNPSDQYRNLMTACSDVGVGGPCSCLRSGAFCCCPFRAPSTSPPYCATVGAFRYIAYGQLVDTDRDLIVDLYDNCPYVGNIFQTDIDNDQIGDVCDNCPYTYNPDQAAVSDGGVGNACNCSVPGVLLGPNGCPCTDGGAATPVDGGHICGLIVTSDGGLSDGG